MRNMKRQHLISLIIVTVIGIWIGGATTIYSLSGLSGSTPPSIVIENIALQGDFRPDEHHQERYLDWSASPHAEEMPHYSLERESYSPEQESRNTMTSENGPPLPQLTSGSVCLSPGRVVNATC